MKKKNQTRVFPLLAALVLATSACVYTLGSVEIGPLMVESESVALDSADSVFVDIEMDAGGLNITGGSEKLMEAEFAYNVAEMKPVVSYSEGNLSILSPDFDNKAVLDLDDLDEMENIWDIALSDNVPLDMDISLGAGNSILDLGTLSLGRLDIKAGAGNVVLDLAGSPTLSRLDVEVGAGKFEVDLSGDWQSDLHVEIDAGVGSVTVMLPRDIGVRVDVDSVITDVNAFELSRDGNAYVNDAFGETDVTLQVEINTAIGEINLLIIE